MISRAVRTVFRKELTDMLRDRRTLVSMIVVPLVVMPVLLFGFGTISAKLVRQARAEVNDIALLPAGTPPAALAEALSSVPTLRIVPAPQDWRREVAEKRLRAVVEAPDDFSERLTSGRAAAVRIFHYEGDLRSGIAAGQIEKSLEELRTDTVRQRLVARNLPAGLVDPFTLNRENVAPPEKVGGAMIGGMIPYFLLILALGGAMYPAMDLTAGEKERGTMETLLTSPVPRLALVLGKLGVVLGVGFASLAVSLGSLSLSFAGLRAQVGTQAFALDPAALLATVALSLPLIVLLASLLLMLSLFARSMKEAQSYVTPILFVTIFGAVGAMLPGLELRPSTALVPILNVALASKQMLTGIYQWGLLALIFSSTVAYAAVALGLCVVMFRRESVLFRA